MKKIYIAKSRIQGKGLFAGESIPKGEKIQYIQGTKVKAKPKNEKDRAKMANWYGMGRYTWVDPGDTPFRYLNHSCEPNAAVAGKKTLIALEHIKPDDELTIDYSMTDADPHWSLECRCGAKTCRKHVRAIYTVPPEVFKRHMPYVPQYFQRAYIRNHVRQRVRAQKA